MDRSYNMEELGYIIGRSTPFVVYFLSKSSPRVGEYVIVEHPEGDLLAMVEESYAGNPFIPEDMTNINTIEVAGHLVADRHFSGGSARIISKISTLADYGVSEIPKTPPMPSSKVYKASKEVLLRIFLPKGANESDEAYFDKDNSEGYIRIGVLANHPDVPIFVKVDPMISRHMAVLAITGAGKSNAVSVLTERIVKELKGTVLLFDMHGEYSSSAERSGILNKVPPKINPFNLNIYELQRLAKIGENAIKQQSILRRIYNKLREEYKKRDIDVKKEIEKNYIEKMIEILEMELKLREGKEKGKKSLSKAEVVSDKESSSNAEEVLSAPSGFKPEEILSVLNKLEDLKENYKELLSSNVSGDIDSLIKPGKLNIVDLADVDENGSDVVVSYYLRRVLNERKRKVSGDGKGYPVPILVVLEEAHILVPKEGETLTKEVVGKIAREGRKFGVGICLVSQRPKNIDENSLSQTNNKIILKIVEPNDLQYVQRSTEQLSNELLQLLPGLRTGEAILLGEFTRIPVLVKIDENKSKTVGKDLRVTKEWYSYSATPVKSEVEDYLEMYGEH